MHLASSWTTFLASEALRKFSRGQTLTSEVFKSCTNLRALQRINFRGHTTYQSFFIAINATTGWFSQNRVEISKFSYAFCLIFVIFWRTFWLQKALENFLEVKRTRLRYLKDALTSGLYNAPTFEVIQHTNHFLLQQTQENGDFLQNQVEMSKFSHASNLILDDLFDFKGP